MLRNSILPWYVTIKKLLKTCTVCDVHLIIVFWVLDPILWLQYNMYAMENKYIAELGRVNATDKDQKGGDNWKIKYNLVNPSGHFAIRTDPVSNQGIISVVKVRLLHQMW